MRRSFYMLMVFTSLTSFTALADEVPVDSKIKAATVYSDRAMLTRQAKVDIPAGAHTLVFNGIPASIFTDSLRAGGTSVANVKFGAVTHKRQSSADFIAPREQALNDQLITLQDQRAIVQADKTALEAARVFLDNLGKQAGLRADENIAEIDLNPQSWGGAADAISSKMAENIKAGVTVQAKLREIDKTIKKVQNELRELRTGQKQTYTVMVPYEADAATTLTVKLDYQIPNVTWQPVYDARLDTDSGDLKLVQYGSVTQRTGEDWTDISLILSTAQPSRGAGLPDLSPQWVSLYSHRDVAPAYVQAVEQQNMMMTPMPMQGKAARAQADMAMEESVEREVVVQTAAIETNGFVGEYKILGPSTVKSDGTQAKLLVGNFDTKSTMQVQVKPQFGTDAYLVAKTTLQGEAPILPGQVSLFRDDAYIGQTYVQMLRPGDEENLAFGIDDNVRVKRNVLKDERSEAGLISKDSVIEKHFVTSIQNLHKTDIEIAVLETVPASKNEKIRVEILKDVTTDGYETDVDDVKGLTKWVKTFKPQEKADVKLGWKVSWPKGENISGL